MCPDQRSVVAAPALLAGLLFVASGCVVHEARITVPPPPPRTADQEAAGPTTVALGSSVRPAPAEPVVFRGPLPQDIRVSTWRRDEDGVIYRGEQHVMTPLPWWQRFPCDAFVDLVPIDATASTHAIITPEPVQSVDERALHESARCDGYATGEAAARK